MEKDTGTDQILRLKIQNINYNNIQLFLSFVRMEKGAWGMEDEAWLEAWGMGHGAESVGHSMNIGYEHGAWGIKHGARNMKERSWSVEHDT